MLFQLGKLGLERFHAAADMAAVGLDFRLAGTSGADTASQTGHLNALAGQTRQHVFELRQLDLQFALFGTRAERKNIQNQGGAVNDADVGEVFDIFYLRRGKLAVNDNQIYLLRLTNLLDFLQLAGADVGGAFRLLQLLRDRKGRLGAGAFDKLLQLIERRLRVVVAGIDAHQQRARHFFFIAYHNGFLYEQFINLLFTVSHKSSII